MELATKRPSDMDQFSYVEPIGHNGSRPVSTAPVTGTVDAHAVWPRGCGRARPGVGWPTLSADRGVGVTLTTVRELQ